MSVIYWAIAFTVLTAYQARAESEAFAFVCRYRAQDKETTQKLRKYAPDRKVDVLHIRIDVTPDFRNRTVAGKTVLRFKPIALPLQALHLHAVDLDVLSVEGSVAVSSYNVTDEAIEVRFSRPIEPGEEATVTVAHRAQPTEGLYFRTPEMGYRKGDIHLFTQGEAHEARHWFPSFDYPNEKFTSEVVCRVPEELVVLSNGRQISEAVDSSTGQKTVHWLQDKPHVNYLIALAAGRFQKLEGKYRDIPLAFYTPPSQFAQAENTFRVTAGAMAFLEEEIGVPYPWDQYNQVVVDDFVAGGMENTTLTILSDGFLFTPASETIRFRSSDDVVVHELAHQWFGDYVTCKDWSHIWLNEGFATYYPRLFEAHRNGRDLFLYDMYKDARNVLGQKGDLPMVYKGYAFPMDQFDYRAYPKGAWVLHMLRTQLGEDLFRQCIKAYVEQYAFQSVVTEDLNRVIESLSGRSFDAFFDQYVYHGRHPELTVSYAWQGKDRLAKVTVKQTQKLSEKVMLFTFPTRIRFKVGDTTVDHEVVISEAHHDFYVPLEKAPDIVRFDPDYGVLAKVSFKKPRKMLYAQLKDTSDVIGRIFAAEGLKSKKDQKTVDVLKEVLNTDSFYGVREAAAAALKEIHTSEAFEALSASLKQADARVRSRVVRELAGFYRKGSLAATRKVLETEKNPNILATAIRNLGKYPGRATRKTLLAYLDSDSYRNQLAFASIRSIRTIDDPSYIGPVQKVLETREAAFRTWGFGRGLDSLAYLARDEDKKDRVRTFLVGYLEHPKEEVRRWAIIALGTLKDPRAIPLVSTFTGGGKNKNRIQRAARDALKSLREARKVTVDLKVLRDEVMELKEDNEELKKEFEDLKKRLEAKEGGKEKAEEKE